MITCLIQGGLGNQMFQFAAAYALSIRTKQKLNLDTAWFDHIGFFTTKRIFELNIFPNIQVPCGHYMKIFHRKRFKRTHEILEKIHFDYERKFFKLFYEEGRDFSEEFLFPIQKTYYLNGYWQSEKYFCDLKKEIREIFRFPDFKEPKDILFSEEMKKNIMVSLHVRRTDYISNQDAALLFSGICDRNYYQDAIQFIMHQEPECRFAVFSDDIPWCRKNLSLPGNPFFVDWHEKSTSFRDMQLISLCKHHINANSSFSWWGAWLGDKGDSITIVPQKWINGPDPFLKDRVPEKWIRI